MTGRPTTKKRRMPEPASIPEIEVGVIDSEAAEPPMDTLRAARNLLLSEYGPCAADHPDLLFATARRLQRDADQSS